MHMPKSSLFLSIFCITLHVFLPDCSAATAYTITYTGAAYTNTTPTYLSIGGGHAHPQSNFKAWLKYLKPNAYRYFIPTINNWTALVNGKNPMYGKSIGGSITVINQATWSSAVAEIRGASSLAGQPDFWTWLLTDTKVQWSQLQNALTASKTTSSLLACLGNANDNLPAIAAMGIKVLVLHHVTCKNLVLTNSDPTTTAYWQDRWELYRWFYAVGRFFAKLGSAIDSIELYNEPDLLTSCLTAATWLDEVRVRSLAFQHAYMDDATYKGITYRLPALIVPPMSAPKFSPSTTINPTDFGRLAVDDVHTKFPAVTSKNFSWWNAQEFSYHQYNTPGYGMRSAWDNVQNALAGNTNGQSFPPARVTEHNCYAASAADAYQGIDIMNQAATGACLAGQFASIVGRIRFSSVQKFSQTASSSFPSGVAKNGIVWGDLGSNTTSPGFCNVGDTTKAAEAYRLILRRTPGNKPLMAWTSSPSYPLTNNFTFYTTSDSLAYYIYLSNYVSSTQPVTFDLSHLPGVVAGSDYIISAVTDTLHGEVAALSTLSSTSILGLTQPANSVAMITIPRVAYTATTLIPADDSFLSAGSNSKVTSGGTSSTLRIYSSPTTTQSTTAVAVMKFNLGTIVPTKIIAAILTVTQSTLLPSGTPPQILTVLGTNETWSETSLSWTGATSNLGLRAQPDGNAITSISKNFINWNPPNGSVPIGIVGHLTATSSVATIALDVVDYLTAGNPASFVIMRPFRFDARGTAAALLPADVLGSAVTLNSKEASANKPTLKIYYAS